MADNTKNKLNDLNDHLFEQMERLNDDHLKGDALIREISRAKAMANIAAQIVGTARVVLDAALAIGGGKIKNAPPLLGMNGHAAKEE